MGDGYMHAKDLVYSIETYTHVALATSKHELNLFGSTALDQQNSTSPRRAFDQSTSPGGRAFDQQQNMTSPKRAFDQSTSPAGRGFDQQQNLTSPRREFDHQTRGANLARNTGGGGHHEAVSAQDSAAHSTQTQNHAIYSKHLSANNVFPPRTVLHAPAKRETSREY